MHREILTASNWTLAVAANSITVFCYLTFTTVMWTSYRYTQRKTKLHNVIECSKCVIAIKHIIALFYRAFAQHKYPVNCDALFFSGLPTSVGCTLLAVHLKLYC